MKSVRKSHPTNTFKSQVSKPLGFFRKSLVSLKNPKIRSGLFEVEIPKFEISNLRAKMVVTFVVDRMKKSGIATRTSLFEILFQGVFILFGHAS